MDGSGTTPELDSSNETNPEVDSLEFARQQFQKDDALVAAESEEGVLASEQVPALEYAHLFRQVSGINQTLSSKQSTCLQGYVLTFPNSLFCFEFHYHPHFSLRDE